MVKPKDRKVTIYVEGGSSKLVQDMRRAFSAFFAKTSLGECQRPKVMVCGSREDAFRDFKIAIRQEENALLLVDGEKPIHPSYETEGHFKPWAHLKYHDRWDKPDKAKDEDCHLMAQVMEAWFLADWEAVSQFYGQGFKASAKPNQAIEKISKEAIYDALEKATKECKTKARYGKSAHSFKLLGLISSDKVIEASPWAKRFVEEIHLRKTNV